MLTSLGSAPTGQRLDRIRQSPNYRHGSFRNILETRMMADHASYYDMTVKFLSKGNHRVPEFPLPTVKTNLHQLPEREPILVWFGHSSYLLRVGGKNILVDPVFSNRASPFQSVGVTAFKYSNPYRVSDMPDIDLLIITHDHYDHLDSVSIHTLASRTNHVVTTLGVGAHLERWGFAPEKIRELDWYGKETAFENFEITCTPGRHFSGRSLKRNQTLWGSFVLKYDDLTLLIGGDSGYDHETYLKIGRDYGPFKLAILECGQYNEMWPQIHMMPEETVQASIDLQATALMPVHWGKFSLALHSWWDSIERAKAAAVKHHVQLATPLIGEVMRIGNVSTSAWWKPYIAQ